MTDAPLAPFATALLDAAKRAGADSADAIVVDGTSVSIGVLNGALEQAERSEGIDLGLRVLVGVANLTDKEPPRVSSVGDGISSVGNSVFFSQYDWLGRRVFANLTYSFD